MLNVYIATSRQNTTRAQQLRHRLRVAGFDCSHAFAGDTFEAEHLEKLSIDWVRSLIALNDAALDSAHVVLALAGESGDVSAEALHALELGMAVVWVGTERPLTAYRHGVIRVVGDDDAVHVLWACQQFLKRPWRPEREWARAMIRELVERLTSREAHAAPEGAGVADAG